MSLRTMLLNRKADGQGRTNWASAGAFGLCCALGVYGFVLALSGVYVAGAGDGTYVLCALFSAPGVLLAWGVSHFEFPNAAVWAFVGATSVLWASIGRIMTPHMNRRHWIALGVGLTANYLTSVALLTLWTDVNWVRFGEYMHMPIAREVILGSLLVYALGQVVIWSRYFGVRER